MTLTRSEVRENRIKWAKFMMEPGRRKGKAMLDDGNGSRCCLGHACKLFDIKREGKLESSLDFKYRKAVYYGNERETLIAPKELVELVGLWTENGDLQDGHIVYIKNEDHHITALTSLNDDTNWTTWQIGDYLLSVVEGGENTPFFPLTDYPE